MRIKRMLLAAMTGGLMLLGATHAQAQVGGGSGFAPRPPGPAPVGYVYRWVPPEYRTVSDRVWIPDRIDKVMQWMEISPGRWAQVLCDVLVPGHWEYTTRQVQVSPGYWQLVRVEPVLPPPVIVSPPVIVVPRPAPIYDGAVGVEGYASDGGEDLSKFSGLSEWPDRK